MPVILLISEVVVIIHSRKIGNTTERGLSPLIMAGVILVILVTNKEIYY